MKTTLLLFFTLVVSTMAVIDFEDIVGRMATYFGLSRDEVRACVNMTNVTPMDLMHFDEAVVDDLQTAADFDDAILRVGCMFACSAQKKEMMTGAHLNINKVKEIFGSKAKRGPHLLSELFQILDTCADRVQSKTNECEVTIEFLFCGITEMQKKRWI